LIQKALRAHAPCIRFTDSSSYSIWSYSERATKNTRAVTFSKQWIHFLRSLL
jgi:hypothetical protein